MSRAMAERCGTALRRKPGITRHALRIFVSVVDAGSFSRAGIHAVALEGSLDIPTVRAFIDHLLSPADGARGMTVP